MPDFYTLKVSRDEKTRLEDLLRRYVEGCANYSLMDADLLSRFGALVPDFETKAS